MWRAADIGTYFKFAAIAAFQVMATDPGITDAIYLLGRIKTLGGDVVSERDMHRACQSRFPKKDVLLAAIDRLVDHGYLLPTDGQPAKRVRADQRHQNTKSIPRKNSDSNDRKAVEIIGGRTDRFLSFLSLVLLGTNFENVHRVSKTKEHHDRHHRRHPAVALRRLPQAGRRQARLHLCGQN